MLADRQTHTQTDRQTDTLITILRSPIGGGVTYVQIKKIETYTRKYVTSCHCSNGNDVTAWVI